MRGISPWYAGQGSGGKGQRGGRGQKLCVAVVSLCCMCTGHKWSQPPAKGHRGWPVNSQAPYQLTFIYANAFTDLPVETFAIFLSNGWIRVSQSHSWMDKWMDAMTQYPFPGFYLLFFWRLMFSWQIGGHVSARPRSYSIRPLGL